VIPGHYTVVLKGGASPQAVAEDHGLIRSQTYRYALNGFAGAIPRAKLDVVRRLAGEIGGARPGCAGNTGPSYR